MLFMVLSSHEAKCFKYEVFCLVLKGHSVFYKTVYCALKERIGKNRKTVTFLSRMAITFVVATFLSL